MMIVISCLFAVIMVFGIYFYIQQNRAAARNRYRQRKTVVYASQTLPEHTTSSVDDRDEMEEDVLGLKQPEKNHASENKAATIQHKSTHPESDCVIALYLMAPESTEYAGYELLQALLSAGLRYGKQRIFNRHEHKDGRGVVLFHCASAMSPGTFDLTQMGAFSCKGLCLFFKASDVEDPLSTLDCMLETIDQLVDDIGGQVLDDQRALFTKERMIQYRQKIRAVENSRVTADLFQ